ncbi:uncharacterized protein V2V93DRAFT_365035 [Kockiozyma suomiensis]|uniref:uncharacterized protein n=1 Tax=Kockiozyma suomiensis TaxID=1337062 RepID=UPI00334407AF
MAKVLSSMIPFSSDSQLAASPRLGRARARSFSKVSDDSQRLHFAQQEDDYDDTDDAAEQQDPYSKPWSTALSMANSSSPPSYVYKPARGPSKSPSRPPPRPRQLHSRSNSTTSSNPFADSLVEDADSPSENPFLSRRERRAHTVSGTQPDLSFLPQFTISTDHQPQQPPQLTPKPSASRTRPRAKTLSGMSSPLRSASHETWVNYRNEDASCAPVPVFAEYGGRSPRHDDLAAANSDSIMPPPLLTPKPDLKKWRAGHR